MAHAHAHHDHDHGDEGSHRLNWATGLTLAFAAVEAGVDVLDASCGGLGGCPFAPGAAGNAATEDLVFFLNGIGVETGMDAASLVKVARQMQSYGLKTLGHLVVSSFGREKEGCCGA